MGSLTTNGPITSTSNNVFRNGGSKRIVRVFGTGLFDGDPSTAGFVSIANSAGTVLFHWLAAEFRNSFDVELNVSAGLLGVRVSVGNTAEIYIVTD